MKQNQNGHDSENSLRQDITPEAFARDLLAHLKYTLAVDPEEANDLDRYNALVLTIRDRLIERWLKTKREHRNRKVKTVYYLSFEFLMGRAIGNNVLNLGFEENIREALGELGFSWEKLKEIEEDEALGNGGLGRLAACFLDSLATLNIPAYGYGLRYEYGLFKQELDNGYQRETPDDWLKYGNPWELRRNDIPATVQFGGRVARNRKDRAFWVESHDILGIPYDMPVVGYGGKTVNTLRLWKSESPDKFDYARFNRGEYYSSVEAETEAAALTKILYPNDSFYHGQELRFKQQYFFVSCSLQDILRRFKEQGLPVRELPAKVAIQLNDTHPAIAVPELMRLLIDTEGLSWDEAWRITVETFGYTNHTLMPEALETWPIPMVETLLPRHMEIIYTINHHFLQRVSAHFPGDTDKLNRMSIIEESEPKRIRMAHLAIIGSHSTNGVAELHSRLITETLVPDFYALFPRRFNNKTNGITQRRWLLKSNPELSGLITGLIGDGWVINLNELSKLKPFAEDAAVRQEFLKIKRGAKESLSRYCRQEFGFTLNPESLFDVQVKRIHEYKRQLLNALKIVILYNRIRNGGETLPQTFLISGKAAPGYAMAKLIIKFINNIASVINGDPDVRGLLKVHFLPDYRVSLAERIFPAADLSEQISTAGTEASGTGNMKFMLNGALTLGTMDGANIEIAQEVGKENILSFGLSAAEAEALRAGYEPARIYQEQEEIRQALDLVFSGHFNISEPGIFEPLRGPLLEIDHYLHLADLASYMEAYGRGLELYGDKEVWSRKALLNIAAAGKFSSDRTIKQYADEIWHVSPLEP